MKEGYISLPYVKGVGEKLKKIYNDYGVRMAFKCGKQVKDAGNSVKSEIGCRRCNVVYEIPCICGDIYIGQTERSIGVRHREHEADLRLTRQDIEDGNMGSAQRRAEKSRLVQHYVNGCDYNPDWENVKVVGTDRGWISRRLRETFYSLKRAYNNKEVINDTDVKFDESWTKTLENFWAKERRFT